MMSAYWSKIKKRVELKRYVGKYRPRHALAKDVRGTTVERPDKLSVLE